MRGLARWLWGPALVVLALPAAALAQDLRGVTVSLGGGVEGYSGDLAPVIDAGPAWGVTAAFRPTSVLGLEIGYRGAANEIEGVDSPGADLVRNGGEAVATLGLSATAVQPYLLGGLGLSRYDVRADAPGFQDDVTGSVPLGAGLRAHVGDFTADLRLNYSLLFNEDFAPVDGNELAVLGAEIPGGQVRGMLNIGATF